VDELQCPSCSVKEGRWLEGSSKDAYVDYFRCDACGHVWNIPKKMYGGVELRPSPVTVTCPVCGARETDCLSDLSAKLTADVLRCGACGHVWTHERARGEPPCEDLKRRTA
jgi:uncharacterized Zn finger protein